MADGMKITLSGIGNGLTRDINNRLLLPVPLVLQCPPLEMYPIAHTFNFGTYDTVDDDQYSRRGSRQLDTWQFDTLMMYLGTDDQGNYHPPWVPFPVNEPGSNQYQRPEWYVEQIRSLFNAGSPFRYVAVFPDATVVHSTYAVLTGFTEEYRHGEGDAIYFTGMAFQEWRDPRGNTLPRPSPFPASARFRRVAPAGRYIAYDLQTNRIIKTRSPTTGTTFADLARSYYGNAALWRTIAKANKCTGAAGDAPVFTTWFRSRLSRGEPNVTLTIPKPPV
jgi:hypothetical protein